MATAKKNGAVAKKSTAKKTTKKKAVEVAEPKEMGRPTAFTVKIGDEICERMANGESLLRICKDEHMPHRATVHRWLLATHKVKVNGVDQDAKKFPNFCDKYEIAVALRADHMFDEIEEIADGAEEIVRKGAEKKSGAYANTQRLRIDARKWYLSKIMPKKFSDKNVHVTEDEEGNLKPIVGNVIQFAPQSNE